MSENRSAKMFLAEHPKSDYTLTIKVFGVNCLRKLSTKDMTQIAICTAMLSVSALIAIPVGPVPVTLQVFFFLLIPTILGSFKGTISLALYLLLGLIGLPVFAGGSGGIQSFLSPSFGYLIGQLVLSPLVGLIGEGKTKQSIFRMTGFMTIAIFLLYSIGMSYQYVIMNYVLGAPITFRTIVAGNLTVFLPLDIMKAIGAAIVYNRVIPVIGVKV